MKKGIIGVSGEYFVAAELSQLGIIATLTLKNTPCIDILATNLESGKFVNIQVKTMSEQNKTGWVLSKKDEIRSDIKNHFYILVNLLGWGKRPEYYIIPQKVVADFLYEDHREWLSGKSKRKGIGKRKDSDRRLIRPSYRILLKYKDNWDILKLK